MTDIRFLRALKIVALGCLGLLAPTGEAGAYIILPEQCRAETAKCLKSGEMDFIFIYDGISRTDAEFFKQLDEAWPANKPLPIVYVDSPGGKLYAGIDIGRVLRKRGGIIATGNPFTKRDDAECSSACVLVAAGAPERRLAHIGVHGASALVSQGRRGKVREAGGPESLEATAAYLKEMGIDPEVHEIEKRVPFDQIEEFVLNDDVPLEGQKIVSWGFYMPVSEAFVGKEFPRSPVHGDESYRSRLEFAALNGSMEAAHDLGLAYESEAGSSKPDYEKAAFWFEFASQRGDLVSTHTLAESYAYGHWGSTNLSRAIDLYKVASQKGFSASQNNLGWAYYTGEGVEKNIAAAVFWVTQSAAQGEPFAYGSLCEMHWAEDVFPKDDIEALKWCSMAAESMPKGKARNLAIYATGVLQIRMDSASIDAADALVYAWKPLKKAQFFMADVDDW